MEKDVRHEGEQTIQEAPTGSMERHLLNGTTHHLKSTKCIDQAYYGAMRIEGNSQGTTCRD